MAVAVCFGVNADLASMDLVEVFSGRSTLIPLLVIIVLAILFGRPLALKVIYSLLYEPYSRVEAYHETTANDMHH